MSSEEIVVYVLTALAAVVIVLTRLRLGKSNAARRIDVGSLLLGVHTVAGALALVTWLVFLLGEDALGEDTASLVGIVAVGFWWIVVVAGLLILVRWLPTRGKHAAEATSDTWSDGPGLSILAHVGMLVGVAVMTWAYLEPGTL